MWLLAVTIVCGFAAGNGENVAAKEGFPTLLPVEHAWAGVSAFLECHFISGFHDSVCPSTRGAATAADATVDALEAVRDRSLTAIFTNKSSEQTAIRKRFPVETGAAAPAGVAEREALTEPVEIATALVAARWASIGSQHETVMRTLMAYACSDNSSQLAMRGDGASPNVGASQLLPPLSPGLRRWCIPTPLVGPFHAEQVASIEGYQAAASRGEAQTPPPTTCASLAASLEGVAASLDRATAVVPSLMKALSELRARVVSAMRRSAVFQGMLPILEASSRRPMYQVTRDKRATGRRLARSAIVTRTAWCLGLQPGAEEGAMLGLGELPGAMRESLGLPQIRPRPGIWSAVLPGAPRIPASGCPSVPPLRLWGSPTADGRWFEPSEAWWRRLPDTTHGRLAMAVAPLAAPLPTDSQDNNHQQQQQQNENNASTSRTRANIITPGLLESRWAMSGANWAYMREPGANALGFKMSDSEGLVLEEQGSGVVGLDDSLDLQDTALEKEQADANSKAVPGEEGGYVLAQAVRVISSLPEHATMCDAVEALARAHALGTAARGPLVGADEAEGVLHYADVRPPPAAVAACDAIDALERADFLVTAIHRSGHRQAAGIMSLAGELWREAVSTVRHDASSAHRVPFSLQDKEVQARALAQGGAGAASAGLDTDVAEWAQSLLDDTVDGSDMFPAKPGAYASVSGVVGLDRGELQCHALLRDSAEQWIMAMNTAMRSANVARRLLKAGEGWEIATAHLAAKSKPTTQDGSAASVMADALERWGR